MATKKKGTLATGRARKAAPPKPAASKAVASKAAASKGIASKGIASKGIASKLAAKVGAAKATKKGAVRSKAATVQASEQQRDEARKLALAMAGVGLEHSALNVEIIDVRGKVDYADYVVVMSGRSDRQVSALARHIEGELEKKHGERCLGVEGLPTASWLLMDYGDVVVHIFHEDTRGYYDLETLWLDAARVPNPPVHASE